MWRKGIDSRDLTDLESDDSSDAGAEIYDTEGNIADDDTLIGNIDGRKSTLGALKDYISEGASGGIEEILYADLVVKRNNSDLVPGRQYRITDYIATVKETSLSTWNARAAEGTGHPFDIIVKADDEHTLNEKARAILHEGDSYFANSNLSAWQVWYCLDNDRSRFLWSDDTQGKGVVYRLIDEFQNDCPYDFKGIQFYDGQSMRWMYTFDALNVDASLDGYILRTHNNKIAPYIFEGPYERGQGLNQIVLWSGCNQNTFGYGCNRCSIGSRAKCIEMAKGCSEISIGKDCREISIGNGCSNIRIGEFCDTCTFGEGCQNINFGTNSEVQNYYRCIKFENGVKFVDLVCAANREQDEYYQNVTILSGMQGTQSNRTLISDNFSNQDFHTTYQPKDSRVVSV